MIYSNGGIHSNQIIINGFMFVMVYLFNLIFFLDDRLYMSAQNNYQYIAAFSIILLLFSARRLLIHKGLIIATIIILVALLSLVFNGSSFANMIKIVWPLAIILLISYLKVGSSFLRTISRLSKLFIYIYFAKALLCYRFGNGPYYHNSRVMVNPNSIALMMVYLFYFSQITGKKSNIWTRILVLIGILACRARMSFITLVLCSVVEFFLQKRIKTDKKMTMILLFSLISLGFVFPILFVRFFEIYRFNYGTVEILGKSVFTGREWIWIRSLNLICGDIKTLLWGTGVQEIYLNSSFNLHNTYLMILAQYGLFLSILFFCFVLYIVYKAYRLNRIKAEQFQLLLVTLATLIEGYSEITLMSLTLVVLPSVALGLLLNKELFNNGTSISYFTR